MSTDMIPTNLQPIDGPATDPGAPFIRVMIDKANGRAVIALDAAAIDALTDILAAGAPYDLVTDPGTYGMTQAQADLLSLVAGQLSTPLLKARGWL
jgi:hypothetical protein